MSSEYPTRLSDLYLPTANQTIYTTLKHLKKSTLSLHNRLSSILQDAAYISSTIRSSFPGLPLLANERCGSWYIPPGLKRGSAYFKSTDGHYGAWDFSLRRLNLQVLEVVGREGGAVLVDSTRRGKRMPDALRRTVPVWVLVWNLVLFGGGERRYGDWAFGLQHPGLEESEVRLIEKKVDGWVDGLRGLGLDLEGIREWVKKPIRLVWIVHGEMPPDIEDGRREGSNLMVLCSASRRVLGAEMSEDGYIQGAADDAEGWSGGLTSALFWEHKDRIMGVSEEDLPELIINLIEENKEKEEGVAAVQILPTNNIYLGAIHSMSTSLDAASFALIIDCNKQTVPENPGALKLGCKSGKLGSKDLRSKLSLAVEGTMAILKKDGKSKILVVCESGRDLSVGVVVTLLCLLYNDDGEVVTPPSTAPDKQLVKKRLAWISAVKPDANPSRATLQAVNSFLMQPP